MMVSQDKRISAFVGFSEFLRSSDSAQELGEWAESAYLKNNWFTPANVDTSLAAIAEMIGDRAQLTHWLVRYPPVHTPKKIGLVLAGNIPLVGFHDILCVLISGHHLLVKPSRDDSVLVELLLNKLVQLEPDMEKSITRVERINDADAYIATGSDNTARYFEYYFSSKPHIIRKNRVSVAVLDGNETKKELNGLCEDIFRFFGLGCRNISKLFVPAGYRFEALFESAETFRDYAANHHKYFNNYEYNKSILLVNGDPHLDNGFLILQKHTGFTSPLAVVYYDEFESPESLNQILERNKDQIQCIASNKRPYASGVALGKTQSPGLYDYADGIDVMKFLSEL